MKHKKYIKTGLTCIVLLLFASGFTIATAEQVQNATVSPELVGKVVSPDGRYIYNESDFANAVISSGTTTVPITDDINAWHNISRNAMNNLYKQFNVPGNEIVSLECDFKIGKCTYEISNQVQGTAIVSGQTPLSPSTPYNGWAEDAKYYDSAGTTSFHGYWKVPNGPSNQTGNQTLFYFIALDRVTMYPEILQPVLEWNNGGFGANWSIASWYCLNGLSCQRDTNATRAYVNDSIAGYLEYQGNSWWSIITDDVTQRTESLVTVSSLGVWNLNHVTLEVPVDGPSVYACSDFPGGADFTGLGINNVPTPSWTPEIDPGAKAVCPSLGVTIVSPSEVILNTNMSLVGWSYAKVKTISGTTAGAQTNYPMKLTVYNSTGNDTPGNIYLGGYANSDFSDLRFTKSDGVTLLDYWIESYTSGVNATVWVEVDSIPASPNNTSIYLYYDNPSATSASSGINTFTFFDDFSEGYIDTTKWNTAKATGFSISNGLLTQNGLNQYYLLSTTTYSYPVALRTKVHGVSNSQVYHAEAGFWATATHNIGYHTYNHNDYIAYDNAYPGFYPNDANYIFTGWRIVDVIAKNSSTVEVISTQSEDNYISSTVSGEYVRLGYRYDERYQGYSVDYEWKWILVRNYASPEPTWGA